MNTYLAIDIGDSSGRHIAARLSGGKMQIKEVYRFANGMKNVNGRLVWDVERLFEEILTGIKIASETGYTPDCIGIDTWAVDYVLLDKDDRIIPPVYAYRDGRGAAAAEKFHKEVMPFEQIYSRTGIQYQPFNTLYGLYDDILSGRATNAKTMLMLPDYFGYLLTGVKKQEYTNATSTAMVNASTHLWDAEILRCAGIDESLLVGTLSLPGETCGRLLPSIAEKVGCSAVVMHVASHDTASAVIGAPLDRGQCYISSGTWSLLGVPCENAHTDAESMKCNYSNEGGLNFGFRFQKNIMGLWMIQRVREELGYIHSFAFLADEAEKNPTPLRVDVNDSRFLAPKSMIGEIEAAVGKKLSVGEIAYVIFASLAQSYKEAVGQLEELTGSRFEAVNVIGGGCNNKLLNRLTARFCGKKVIAGPSEATAVGNIIMQAVGTGELKDAAKSAAIIKKSFDITEVTV